MPSHPLSLARPEDSHNVVKDSCNSCYIYTQFFFYTISGIQNQYRQLLSLFFKHFNLECLAWENGQPLPARCLDLEINYSISELLGQRNSLNFVHLNNFLIFQWQYTI